MTSTARRELVQRIREEGRLAAHAGVKRCHVPAEYRKNMNEFQWLNGYDEGQHELDVVAAQPAIDERYEIEALIESNFTQDDLRVILRYLMEKK